MATDPFFSKQTDRSRVKTEIVAGYFGAWANIILRAGDKHGKRGKRGKRGREIAYVDLFAGCGRYDDGTDSTPVFVVRTAIGDPQLSQRLITVFNDKDARSVDILRQTLVSLDGIERLAHHPVVHNREVGTDLEDLLLPMTGIPSLCFVDPYGYKGVSRTLIGKAIAGWGSECILLFNYNRVNPALGNPPVDPHMRLLFGDARADALFEAVEGLNPPQREQTVLREMNEVLREEGARFVLTFAFGADTQRRTSHYLIHVTKHMRGHERMKSVMARLCSKTPHSTATYQYSPLEEMAPRLPGTYSADDELAHELLEQFGGRSATLNHVYTVHSPEKPFQLSDYRRVVRSPHDEGVVSCRREGGIISTGTMPADVLITFPPLKEPRDGQEQD